MPAPKHCEGWGAVQHDCHEEDIHCCCDVDDYDLRHAHPGGCYQEQQVEQNPVAHQHERAAGGAGGRVVPLP